MAQHTNPVHDQTEKLNFVREGMTVYDSESNDIGTVETIYFGSASDANTAEGSVPATASADPALRDATFLDVLGEAFDPRDDIPAELAERLRYNGFIKIDGGWFGSDRYVMPEQIASVSDEGVYLNTQRGNLAKE